MDETIRLGTGKEDHDAIAALIREYVGWLRARYAHDPWFVTEVLDKQSLDDELRDLPAKYGAPNGKALLAVSGAEVRGCGAYRRLGPRVCEMKRVFVPPRFQGQGLGRRLCTSLIDAARAEGFDTMKLDTGRVLTEAISMYNSLGFQACAPYIDYPAHLLPYLHFMELRL